MSRIRHAISRTLTSRRDGGRSRYVAPELEAGMVLSSTEPSDIYSFAMTIIALGTGVKPFFDIERDLEAAQHKERITPYNPGIYPWTSTQCRLGARTLIATDVGRQPRRTLECYQGRRRIAENLRWVPILSTYQPFTRR